MDKTSKQILNKLIAANKGTSLSCSTNPAWNYMCDITIADLSKSIHVPIHDVHAAMQYLSDTGYLAPVISNNKFGTHRIGFCLSHKGLHYSSFKREETLHFIQRSILTPIVVTLLTSGAIHVVSALLSLIQVSVLHLP